MTRWSSSPRRASAACPTARSRRAEPARFGGGAAVGRRQGGPGPSRRRLCRRPALLDPDYLCRAAVRRHGRRRRLVAPVPGGARGARPGLFGLGVAAALSRLPACSMSMPRPRGARRPRPRALIERGVADAAETRDPARARPGPDAGQGGPADVARKLLGPGRLCRAPARAPRPAGRAGRDRRASSTR